MKTNKQKHKVNIRISTLMVIITLAFVGFFVFTVGIDVNVNDKGIVAKAPLVTTTKVSYDDMKNVELVKDIDLGRRTNGLGDFIVQAGHFKNDRYGSYMLYSYTRCKSYVDITCKDGSHIVINAKTKKATNALFEKIKRYR